MNISNKLVIVSASMFSLPVHPYVFLSPLQMEYEELKVCINRLVAKATKVPEEGWIMQDGTPWPGNNTGDHPGMIQVNKKRISSFPMNSNDFMFSVYILPVSLRRLVVVFVGLFGPKWRPSYRGQ